MNDEIAVCNDYIDRYQDTLHVLGFHLNHVRVNSSRKEIEEKLETVQRAKNSCSNRQWLQELNKIREKLLDVKQEKKVVV